MTMTPPLDATSTPNPTPTPPCPTVSRSMIRDQTIQAQQVSLLQPNAHNESLPPIPPNAHRLVLMRHGESEFNNANIFTGWCDVALTQRGVVEAIEAGQVFMSHSLEFRKCYSSFLNRAIITAQRALEAAGISYTPLQYDWRLNERHYGAFQGLSKDQTVARLGQERVQQYRRGFATKPPLMTPDHPHYDMINNDARYRNLEGIPLGESLQDCQIRVVAAWQEILVELKEVDDAKESPYSLLVAHNNTLRALVMHLDQMLVEDIEKVSIPTAIPFYYDIDKTTGKVVQSGTTLTATTTPAAAAKGVFRGTYISDERKKKSFLERTRAPNDPWLWALHDHQVTKSMLAPDHHEEQNNDEQEKNRDSATVAVDNNNAKEQQGGNNNEEELQQEATEEQTSDMAAIVEEAKLNTQFYTTIH